MKEDDCDEEHCEELLRAAMCDDFDDVKRLFSAERKEYADSNGKTVMHAACQAGNLEMVQWLQEQGVGLGTKNKAGRAPIQEACETGNVELVQYLHAQGVAVNVANDHNINTVHSACKSGSLKLVQFLHSHGCPLDAKDSGDGVAILYAARGAEAPSVDASLELVKWLVQQGADVNAKNRASITPLRHAETRQGAGEHNAAELITFLKANGATL
eukprot:COSAG05_NODE_2759_length_2673_cov_2.130925_3_plen_214_part_00